MPTPFFQAAPGTDLTVSLSVLSLWLASQSEVVQVMDRMGVSKTYPLIPTEGSLQSRALLPFSPFLSLSPWIFIYTAPLHPHNSPHSVKVKTQSPEESIFEKMGKTAPGSVSPRFSDRYS